MVANTIIIIAINPARPNDNGLTYGLKFNALIKLPKLFEI